GFCQVLLADSVQFVISCESVAVVTRTTHVILWSLYPRKIPVVVVGHVSGKGLHSAVLIPINSSITLNPSVKAIIVEGVKQVVSAASCVTIPFRRSCRGDRLVDILKVAVVVILQNIDLWSNAPTLDVRLD